MTVAPKPGFQSRDLQVSRVRRRLSARAARLGVAFMVLPVVGALLVAVASAVFGPLPDAAMPLLYGWVGSWLGGAPLSLVTAGLASLAMRRNVTSISVSEGDLRLEGRRSETIPARDIEGALVVIPEDGEPVAEIALRSGDVLNVRARVGKRSRAGKGASAGAGGDVARGRIEVLRGLVGALGFGGTERRTIVPLGSTRSPLWSAISAVFAGVLATVVTTCLSFAALSASDATTFTMYSMGIVFTVATLLAARLWGARRLVIGADGVELQGPLRKRFFPRKQIFGVEKIRGNPSLLLGGGDDVEEVRLPVESPERGDAVLLRIREAMEGDPGPEEAGPGAAVLARGADSIGVWRERLRRLVAPAEGYRKRTVPVDVLLKTAADAESPAELRVGAALAIAQSGDEDARRRLRIATEAIANEPVRLALEAAAEADAEDEAIAEACARAGSSVRSPEHG